MNKNPVKNPDRQALFVRLQENIREHQAEGKKLALVLIKLNQFRQINVMHGYRTGDHLLAAVFSRLDSLSRNQDYIARIGNSEFAMLLPGIFNEGHASLAALKLLGGMNEPFQLDDRELHISANIGIALLPDHASDIDGLLKKAELALTQAHDDSQSYVVYSEDSRQDESQNWDIESELQHAIARDQFELFFQPQVYLETGKVFGAEALIYWNNGKRGCIGPGIFIPVAEQCDQIYEITKWTLNAALWLKKDWPEMQLPLNVSVNISTRMLSEPGLVNVVENALNIYGSDYAKLTLEITESALVEDVSTSFKVLEELKSMGVNISIDDFGTGYSSMAYFKNIPANELKIDQTFILHMLESKMDRHIVETVINMAQGFGLTVVAEGIEDRETYDVLREMGCDVAQGYYLAKPLSAGGFVKWLNEYQPISGVTDTM